MGSLKPENTAKQELDDSGCVQDASVTTENGYKGQVYLLDLSDDVLLYILKHCTPRDLKALGHTCPRLGTLVCDRTLWTRVDARSDPMGKERLRWLLTHCLSNATNELQIKGYASRDGRCLGIQDLHWPVEGEPGMFRGTSAGAAAGVDVEHFLLRMWYPHLPRFAVSPRWPDKKETETKAPKKVQEARKKMQAEGVKKTFTAKTTRSASKPDVFKETAESLPTELEDDVMENCKGPQFSFTYKLLNELREKCPNLTCLTLEYCNIDYKSTNIRHFPPKLKKLSLKGTRCYNLPLNTSFLCKIQDRLPDLEVLDVSECDWFEPASLMPLSKVPKLQELYMRDCKRLTECVAYASLATRYGFRKLRVLDCRGSPMADSEVSALGWLPCLEELYCAPPEDFRNSSEHTHSWNDTLFTFQELDDWEMSEPEYYKIKDRSPSEDDEDARDVNNDDSEDSLGTSPWWANDRRIIVIQPNANRPEEPPRRLRPVICPFGPPLEPLQVEPMFGAGPEPVRLEPGNAQGTVRIVRQVAGFHRVIPRLGQLAAELGMENPNPVAGPDPGPGIPPGNAENGEVPASDDMEDGESPQKPGTRNNQGTVRFVRSVPRAGEDMEEDRDRIGRPGASNNQSSVRFVRSVHRAGEDIQEDVNRSGTSTGQGTVRFVRQDPRVGENIEENRGRSQEPEKPGTSSSQGTVRFVRQGSKVGEDMEEDVNGSRRPGVSKNQGSVRLVRSVPSADEDTGENRDISQEPERPGTSSSQGTVRFVRQGLKVGEDVEVDVNRPGSSEASNNQGTVRFVRSVPRAGEDMEEDPDRPQEPERPGTSTGQGTVRFVRQGFKIGKDMEDIDSPQKPVRPGTSSRQGTVQFVRQGPNVNEDMEEDGDEARKPATLGTNEPGTVRFVRPGLHTILPRLAQLAAELGMENAVRLNPDAEIPENLAHDEVIEVDLNRPAPERPRAANEPGTVRFVRQGPGHRIIPRLGPEQEIPAEEVPDFEIHGHRLPGFEMPGPAFPPHHHHHAHHQHGSFCLLNRQGRPAFGPSAEMEEDLPEEVPQPEVSVKLVRVDPAPKVSEADVVMEPEEPTAGPSTEEEKPEAGPSGLAEEPSSSASRLGSSNKRANESVLNLVKRPRLASDGDDPSDNPPDPPKLPPKTEKDNRPATERIVVNIDTRPGSSRPLNLRNLQNRGPINAGASTSRINYPGGNPQNEPQNRPANEPQVPQNGPNPHGPHMRPRCVRFRRNENFMHIDVEHAVTGLQNVLTGYHLVTDSAIVRFGRADNENVNYYYIGRNGIQLRNEPGMRPDRSVLRVLSVCGYRNITDRSLEHLATAAPFLRSIDFSYTGVTQSGVDMFKAIRPNCEVEWSEFGKLKEGEQI